MSKCVLHEDGENVNRSAKLGPFRKLEYASGRPPRSLFDAVLWDLEINDEGTKNLVETYAK